MSNYKEYDKILDPITSSIIVVPCVIPPLQVCDKNMIMSCLWNKPENPFTKLPLTIQEFKEFNEQVESQIKNKETHNILKEAIAFSK